MNYRLAQLDDVEILAAMNEQLIRDEGHRNPMSLRQLGDRMRAWLQSEYRAAIFENDGEALGYALFKQEPDWTYLRQFFVAPSKRRQGIGRNAIKWVQQNVWSDSQRVRLDVLIGNSAGIEFWRSLGFTDYCLTMERDTPFRLGSRIALAYGTFRGGIMASSRQISPTFIYRAHC